VTVPWSLLIFDVDGTLVDSTRSILTAMQMTITELRGPVPLEDLKTCVGPPLHESLSRLLHSDDAAEIESAIATYRAHYACSTHSYTTEMPGAREALGALAQARITMAACTYKPTTTARMVLEGLGLADHLRTVVGTHSPGLDERSKGELLGETLRQFSLKPDHVIYIGDHEDDAAAAVAAGVQFARLAPGHWSWSGLVHAILHCGPIEWRSVYS